MTGLMRSMLFGVAPNDLSVFVCVPILLFVVVILATLAPALRAASVDSVEALRCQ
jgi:ABC-type lipoprotein release transport system permease subunit